MDALDIRIGQGVDVHQFADGRKLILGGLEIPHARGLAGHSDADALLHAITDALLGATGRGDIGTYFPDTDPQWKDAASIDLLSTIWKEISADNWALCNIDSTVVTEHPKLNQYIPAIRSSVASILDIDISAIGVKATTCEKMGFLGRGEGLMATAVVLLNRTT